MESSPSPHGAVPFTSWTATVCLALQFCLSPSFVLQANAQSWSTEQSLPPTVNSQAIPLPPPLLPNTPPPQESVPVYSPSPGLSVQVPTGTVVPAVYPGAERIILGLEETMPLTLLVSQNVVGWNNQVWIPVNSQIQGRLQPSNGGTQFVAENLVISGLAQAIPLNATSKVITQRQEIRRGTNIEAILSGAVIGAAAATAIDLIVGDGKVGIGTILMGAAIGAGAGWWTRGQRYATVFVVDAQKDLDLTLNGAALIPQVPP